MIVRRLLLPLLAVMTSCSDPRTEASDAELSEDTSSEVDAIEAAASMGLDDSTPVDINEARAPSEQEGVGLSEIGE